jgi:hypothetical protein
MKIRFVEGRVLLQKLSHNPVDGFMFHGSEVRRWYCNNPTHYLVRVFENCWLLAVRLDRRVPRHFHGSVASHELMVPLVEKEQQPDLVCVVRSSFLVLVPDSLHFSPI